MGIIDCLDTHVLIWGIKKQANPTQQNMIDRAARFIQWLEKEKHTVIIPAPVLGELLMKIPVEQHQNFISQFSKNFIIAPFDAHAASQFAYIWQKTGESYQSNNQGNSGREKIKVDCMIVAIAVAQKANVLYSEDADIIKIANGFVNVKTIPDIPYQYELT